MEREKLEEDWDWRDDWTWMTPMQGLSKKHWDFTETGALEAWVLEAISSHKPTTIRDSSWDTPSIEPHQKNLCLAALQLEKSTHASRSDDALVNKGKERGVKIQACLAPEAKQTPQNVSVQNDTYLGIISRQHYNLVLTEGLER